jgi:hypothetical protein
VSATGSAWVMDALSDCLCLACCRHTSLTPASQTTCQPSGTSTLGVSSRRGRAQQSCLESGGEWNSKQAGGKAHAACTAPEGLHSQKSMPVLKQAEHKRRTRDSIAQIEQVACAVPHMCDQVVAVCACCAAGAGHVRAPVTWCGRSSLLSGSLTMV